MNSFKNNYYNNNRKIFNFTIDFKFINSKSEKKFMK